MPSDQEDMGKPKVNREDQDKATGTHTGKISQDNSLEAVQEIQYGSSYSLCEEADLIPGLAHWVKDPTLQQAVAQVTDAVQIWHCQGLWHRPAATTLI